MMEAARRQDWGAVSIVPLASDSVAALRSYYIDYPLLFISPFGEGRPTVEGGPSILQYYEEAGLPLRGRRGSYAVRCSHERSDDLLIDGRPATVVCGGRDGLSAVRVVSSIEPPAGRGTAARVYRLRRFVF